MARPKQLSPSLSSANNNTTFSNYRSHSNSFSAFPKAHQELLLESHGRSPLC